GGAGVAGGGVIDEPVGTIALARRVLRACGVPLASGLQGRPLLDGSRELVLTEDDMIRGGFAFRTLTTRRYRITRDEAVPARGELYDLADDPGELVNRWDDPALAARPPHLRATPDALMPP